MVACKTVGEYNRNQEEIKSSVQKKSQQSEGRRTKSQTAQNKDPSPAESNRTTSYSQSRPI